MASDNSAGDRDPQKTPLAVDFWRAAFAKLNDSQQEAFYQLLRRIDTSQLQKPQADLPFDATIKRLNELQKNNQAKTLGAISVMSQGDPKTALTDDLFAFDESWQQHVSPVLEASVKGDDFTIANQTTIRSIRSIIDPIVMQDVEDMTGIGNPRDKLAWRGIWDFVQRDAQSPKTGSASETTLLQLKGQPQAFRSQTVSVSGTALTIRRKTLAKTMLNLDHYYELWVDPPERVNDGLICVYAATLPRDFDSAAIEVSETFQTISIPVKIDGRFFKIRSYQDSGKTVSHCPVVVTETFAADIKANQSKANQSAAAAPWRLSTSNVLAFLVLAAIGAMAIAYVVFRSTQTGSRGISKPASKRLERSFDALAEDDSVLTDAQRVSQLNEYLEEDFS